MRVSSHSRLEADLSKLFQPRTVRSDDRALLDRFLLDRDEAAFEVLVERHGPMVRGVCRRVLADSHDEDDAFQATFLVLVRKAGSLRDADRLGPWLYGVAHRVASKARARKLRRREHSPVLGHDLAAPEGPRADLFDVLPIFDAELARTSAKLRDVLVLCLLEGATPEEASDQLGCPVGTVKSRLARGREALRDRLTRRGVSPALALTASSTTWTAPVPASAIRATLAAITGTSPKIMPGVATMLRGVAPAMISKTTVMTSLVLGGIALAGLGTTTWIKSPAEAHQPGVTEPQPAILTPSVDERAREESKQHMRQILLAFRKYHAANDHLPTAATILKDYGVSLLSWRVALLPYLEEMELYKEFHQNEPWDSPHNKALISRMPAVFRTPESPTREGKTRIRGFQGERTVFEGGSRKISFSEITDGTANTILIASVQDPVVWTQPGELPFAADRPVPLLNDNHSTWCLVGMADGEILEVQPTDDVLLKCMITRNGGEVIALAERRVISIPESSPAALVKVTGGPLQTRLPGEPGQAPVPAPPTSPSIEQRLQKLEEKLDRLFQKLSPQPASEK